MGKRVMMILLVWACASAGCATPQLWNNTKDYRPQRTERESVQSMHIFQRGDAVCYLVSGYPNKRKMFSLAADAAGSNLEIFQRNFRRYSRELTVKKVCVESHVYGGKGYRIGVDFTSSLPADQVVELFTDGRWRTVGHYARQGQERPEDFQVHFKKGASGQKVNYYSYNIINKSSPVKIGYLSANDEFDLLASSQRILLPDSGDNFYYTPWEYEKTYDVPLPLRVLCTPPALVLDAMTVVAVLPAFFLLVMAEGF